jgi:hypothetical protein
MANEKLWVAAVDGRRRAKPANDGRRGTDRAEKPLQGPQPEEGLRLIRAFAMINDPARRAALIDQAEKLIKP